ncbi:anti-sigma F factor antagonist [Virgibacillus sp. MSJ-26]|uniref:anti-sigma F factor antagonist n=1 Tax=Virgibacillus sp. MSJ-26 TaxID=2841522 RepID=UPI001C0F5278|nr:anti-sigma F factor antagonist [Virgibacillus sp. MSJ-26]MBU5466315.1 anti-sigma F factor antagonist [Virgibacillus sp. MSJ-26]
MGLTYTFDVRENVLIVRLAGELDHHEAELLRDEWKQMMYHNPIKHVIVNLSDMTFMDSSGLGVILGRYKETLQLGGEMVVCSISPSIKRLFEMSGLFKIVHLEENEEFALETLGVAS